MKKPEHFIEIFLQPGEWYFGDRNTRIRTVLGSCVSLAVWHPRLLVGGMCHYMLPTRGGPAAQALDGRYADEAMALLERGIRAAGAGPDEYQLKMFGGGNMFPTLSCRKEGAQIPARNVETARGLAARYGMRIAAEDLGGAGHRNVIFDVWSGDVWVKRHEELFSRYCEKCEARPECEAG